MQSGAATSYVDLAQVTLYAFWIFFFGLVLYLHREDKREGYPLVSEAAGHTEEFATHGFLRTPAPKVFRLFHGGERLSPETNPPRFPTAAAAAGSFPGAPIEPTGNPLVDGIGPASWAYRDDVPDLTIDGKLKIVPMRDAPDYGLDRRSPDPRGQNVIGADGDVAGVCVDLWVDEMEESLRYLEVELAAVIEPEEERRHVLVPAPFVRYRTRMRVVSVRALLAHQFRDIPRLRDPGQVTRLEEDKLVGYFGGGALYATPSRLGPLL